MILGERTYPVVGQLRGVPPVEGCETSAVETHKTFLGADPEVSIARLDERFRGVLGKSVLDLPGVEHILRDRSCRVERREVQRT